MRNNEPSTIATLTVLARFALSSLSIPRHLFAALWPLIFHGSPILLGLSVPLLIYGLGGPSDLEQLSGLAFISICITVLIWFAVAVEHGVRTNGDTLHESVITTRLRDAIRDRATVVDAQRSQAKTAEAGALSLAEPDSSDTKDDTKDDT